MAVEPLALPGETLLVRAQAGGSAGAGHLMRCLALALAARERGAEAIFALDPAAAPLAGPVLAAGFEVVQLAAAPGSLADSAALAALAASRGARWVVVDGYGLGAEYVSELRSAPLRVLAVDDHAVRGHPTADIVLDQNLGAGAAAYGERPARVRLLLGADYGLLRPEFAARRLAGPARPVPPHAARVLATFGGTDPAGLAATALRALSDQRLTGLTATVLGDPGDAEPRAGVTVLLRSDAMAALMADFDIALAAAGSTCWELACLGVPMLLVAVAENQEPLGERLEAAGAARYLGRATNITASTLVEAIAALADDAPARETMAAAGRALIDGLGASRVEAARREFVSVRDATATDSETLFELATDPVVRAASFLPGSIPRSDHERWLSARLADPERLTLIAEDFAGRFVASVRFDPTPTGEMLASIALAEQFRGRGYAAPVLRAASAELFERMPSAPAVLALVKPENVASQHAFLSAGYREDGSDDVAGQTALRFVAKRGAS